MCVTVQTVTPIPVPARMASPPSMQPRISAASPTTEPSTLNSRTISLTASALPILVMMEVNSGVSSVSQRSGVIQAQILILQTDNYAFTARGGCETEVGPNDELLWAFNAFNAQYFLRVLPTQTPVILAPGQTQTFNVQGTDGESGAYSAIVGAVFAGQTSDGNGNVLFTAPIAPGTYRYKATRAGSIRSNAVTIVVQG